MIPKKRLATILLFLIAWLAAACKPSAEHSTGFLEGVWTSSAVKDGQHGVIVDYRQNMQLHFSGNDGIDSLFVGWFDGGREFRHLLVECSASNCTVRQGALLIVAFKKVDDRHIVVTASSVPEVRELYVGEALEKK